ncbi:biopolymer transporter ExbD [Vibrio fortis]|uniref:Biopolymer transporter ExbD n=1 Tax=Vibrio fortis TaxID=212667 RepID=A0A5N3S3A2_9VIBR|nr:MULTISPECIES: biopolymer transporter ExbD [Vibrio]KAB0289362.1 biopolymer transporter ExbD [Vibrio fortis]KAB0300792.1 biopolymer transporter ExbD [Vibrio fortis]MDK9737975.1 biopolymer transporter ExbD [Vibrio sp. D404a]MDK9796266.1 biopolymer transporter ExbD [Vibrio sp. D449a]QFT11264.1 Biopolymer transport protein ExbD [Vibrio sp. THAF190c]|tara:strand:- start:1003 stop:1425 length:423 start_codon:yes stop_codon:yes gene_type:complete
MGFQTSSDSDELVENHDINVTPLVDVMLVLLIIVMVAAPLATVNVPVDLPSSSAEATPLPDEPLFLTVGKGLELTLGEDKTSTLEQLPFDLPLLIEDQNQRIYLRADKSITYDELMKVMNTLVRAGYSQIALVGLETPQG